MKPLRAFGPLRSRFMLKPIPVRPPLAPIDTVEIDEKKIETKVQGWIELVGESRARAAAALAQERSGSTTLPELLVEMYLRGKGARYVTQLDLGYSRPDFVVFNAPGAPEGAMIIRAQGDHWHGTDEAVGRDKAQRDMLLNDTAQGERIVAVVDVWEHALHEGDDVLDLAYFNAVERPRM